MKQYFEILELQPGATPDEVKKAYRDLAKVWHPDRFKGDSARLKVKAAEKLAEINEAYEKIKAYQARQKARKQANEHRSSSQSGYRPFSPPPKTSGNGHMYSGYARPTAGRQQPPRPRGSIYSQPNTYRKQKTSSSPHTRAATPRTRKNQSSSYKSHRTSESTYRSTQAPSRSLTRKYHPATVQYGPYGRNYGYTYHKRRRTKNPIAIYLVVVALLAVTVAAAYIYIKKSEEQAQPTLAEYPLSAAPNQPAIQAEAAGSSDLEDESVTTEEATAPSAANASAPRSNSTRRTAALAPPGMFTLGSSKKSVIQAQGEPDQVRTGFYRYGFSTVSFEKDAVIGWNESAETPLKVQLSPRKRYDIEFFTVGSSQDEVLSVQGTPDHYRDRGREFRYGESRITFENGRVISWHQHPNYPLRVRLLPRVATNAEYFTFNSTRDEVLSVQGTPDHFSENTFHYGYAIVKFENNRVIEWNQTPNHPLKIKLEPSVPTSSKFFTIGSTRDEVIAAQGTPDQYSERMFKYGYSTVSFDNDRVVSWNQSAASPLNGRSDIGS